MPTLQLRTNSKRVPSCCAALAQFDPPLLIQETTVRQPFLDLLRR